MILGSVIYLHIPVDEMMNESLLSCHPQYDSLNLLAYTNNVKFSMVGSSSYWQRIKFGMAPCEVHAVRFKCC